MSNATKQKLLIMLAITLAGLLCSTLFHYVQALSRDVYPYNTFLFDPAVRYSDFTVVVQESAGLDPYLGNRSAQYPLLALFGYLLSLVTTPGNYLVAYYGLVIACCALLVWVASRMAIPGDRLLTGVLFALLFLGSYPLLKTVDRGNFELLVFALVALGLCWYSRQHYLASGLALAAAASMKLFPLYFLILFLRDRKYKELLAAAGCFAAINLAILGLFKGGLVANLGYLLGGGNVASNPYFERFASGYPLFQKSVSLYNLVKIVLAKAGALSLYQTVNVLLIYKIVAGACLLWLSWFVIMKARDPFAANTVATLAVVTLPFISADYKLLYLFLPVLFFLHREPGRLDRVYAVWFGLLLIPKSYHFLGLMSDSGYRDISVAELINPLLLIGLLLLVLFEGRRQHVAS